MKNDLIIGLDIDDVVSNFSEYFLEYLNLDRTPPTDFYDSRYVDNFKFIADDIDYWENMPALVTQDRLNFKPALFCTARPVAHSKTYNNWLKKQGFKDFELIVVGNGDKTPYLKTIDIFVDDAIHNFVKLNDNEINCYLMDRPHNQTLQTSKRIFDLNDLICL